MIQSEQINELTTALSLAQGEMQNAPLNKTNPHFRSKYADLAAIRDATLPPLTKHGLSIYQATQIDGDFFLLVTRLAHKSGQWIESVYPVPMAMDKPQVMGSALTYARRYSWASICGVASEEDDDANAAQDGAKKTNGMGVRKSSMQAKRDGDWDKFLHDLSDVKSPVGLERLRTEYRQTIFPTWNKDWQQQFEEECEAKLASFGDSDYGLADKLKASVLIEKIQKMDDEDALLLFKEDPAYKEALAALPKPMQLEVRKAGALKMESLRMGHLTPLDAG